jgi:hypothetical protein
VCECPSERTIGVLSLTITRSPLHAENNYAVRADYLHHLRASSQTQARSTQEASARGQHRSKMPYVAASAHTDYAPDMGSGRNAAIQGVRTQYATLHRWPALSQARSPLALGQLLPPRGFRLGPIQPVSNLDPVATRFPRGYLGRVCVGGHDGLWSAQTSL